MEQPLPKYPSNATKFQSLSFVDKQGERLNIILTLSEIVGVMQCIFMINTYFLNIFEHYKYFLGWYVTLLSCLLACKPMVNVGH